MKYFPIKFHVLYIIFTILFSFFGPKIYLNYDKFPVFIYMTSYLLIVSFGFYLGNNSALKHKKHFKRIDIIKILQFFIKVSVILYLINVVYLFASGRLNVQISQVGANYSDFYDYYNQKKEGSLFTFEILFLVISAIPKFVTLTLGFFYFQDLNKFSKRLFLFFIFLIIVTQTFSLGNQKSIGDIVVFLAASLLIKAIFIKRERRKVLMRRIFIILIGLFALLSFTQYSRLASRDISASDLNSKMADYSSFDWEHPLFKVFGTQFGLGIATFITGYLSNGYYGLSKTLELPFEWTYGLGNSVALTSVLEKTANTDIYSNTYLNRMEEVYNIPGKKHWHTIFPWFASDFTFVGTLFIFFIIAYYYGKCWKEVRLFKNPISIIFFCLLTIMFIYVPANNQILHGFDYLIITISTLLIWRNYHNKFNFRIEDVK